MSDLPAQFSEARNLQLDTQFKLISTFTGQAFDSVEKLIALQFDASRATLAQSSTLVRQLLEIKAPGDLFALGRQGPSPLDSALAYGRQLLGIVSTVAPGTALAVQAAPVAVAVVVAPLVKAAIKAVPAAPVAAQASAAPAPEASVAAGPVPVPAPVAKPAGKAVAFPKSRAADTPVAFPKSGAASAPVAAPESGDASFTVPSSVKPIAVGAAKPADATPPNALVSGKPAGTAKPKPPASVPASVIKKAGAPGNKPERKK